MTLPTMSSTDEYDVALRRLDDMRRFVERIIGDRESAENLLLDAMQDARENANSMSDLPWWYGEALRHFKRREG